MTCHIRFFAENLDLETSGCGNASLLALYLDAFVPLRFRIVYETSRCPYRDFLKTAATVSHQFFGSKPSQNAVSWQTVWYEPKTCLFATENSKIYEKRHLLITLREQNKQTWHVTAVLSRKMSIEGLLSKLSPEYRRSTLIASVNPVKSSGWSVLCSNQRDSERRPGVVKSVTGVFRCCKS